MASRTALEPKAVGRASGSERGTQSHRPPWGSGRRQPGQQASSHVGAAPGSGRQTRSSATLSAHSVPELASKGSGAGHLPLEEPLSAKGIKSPLRRRSNTSKASSGGRAHEFDALPDEGDAPDDTRRRGSTPLSKSSAGNSSFRSSDSARTGVKVCLRVRPMSATEIHRSDNEVVVTVEVCGDSLQLIPAQPGGATSSDKRYTKAQPFTFDWVLSSGADQALVYQVIGQPVQEGIADGFHGCVFAYGQTGTGKSHTMFGGSDDSRGLVPRIGEGLFRDLESSGSTWIVKISYIEIYNEKIRDLLRPPKASDNKDGSLEVRSHPKLGVFIEGLTKSIVHSVEDITRLLDFGHKLRVVACTNMNAVSSRSHAIVTMHVERSVVNGPAGAQRVRRRAQLHCVDLAGSERGKDIGLGEERQKESNNINRSLFALSFMISKLAENHERGSSAAHVPHRSSKLTHLLSESLMGNCRTAMVACVAPNSGSLNMTESTIRFAQSVKKIKTRPVQNEDVEGDLVKSLRAEIEQLKQMLAQCSNDKKEAIESKIRATVELHQEFATSLEEQMLSHRVMEKERRRSLLGMGQLLSSSGMLSTSSVTTDAVEDINLTHEGLCPYLANICEDPLLSGRLQYALPPGKVVDIGSDESCTIRIDGLGVQPHMCTVCCSENAEVDVHISDMYSPARKTASGAPCMGTPPNSDPATPRGTRGTLKRVSAGSLYKSGIAEVTVNDKAVMAQHRLKHGDVLRVGRTHAFRFIVPEASACEVTDIVSHLTTSPKEEMLALEFAEHLEERIGSDRAVKVLRNMQELEPLISEMNDLTEELRGGESRDLMFKAHVLIDVTADDDDPELMVALHTIIRPDDVSELSRAPFVVYGCPRSKLEAIWSVENFRRRLEAARDIHLEVSERQEPWGLPTDLDPWRGESIVPHVGDIVEHLNRGAADSVTPNSATPFAPPHSVGSTAAASLALPSPQTVSKGVETDISFNDMIVDTDVDIDDAEVRRRLLHKMMPHVESKLAEVRAELADKEEQLGQIARMREELQSLHAERVASIERDSTSARLHMADVEHLQAEIAKRDDEIARRDEMLQDLQAKQLVATARLAQIEAEMMSGRQTSRREGMSVLSPQKQSILHQQQQEQLQLQQQQQQQQHLASQHAQIQPAVAVPMMQQPVAGSVQQAVPARPLSQPAARALAQQAAMPRVDSKAEHVFKPAVPGLTLSMPTSTGSLNAAPPAMRSSRVLPTFRDVTPPPRANFVTHMAGMQRVAAIPAMQTARDSREASPLRSSSVGAPCGKRPSSARATGPRISPRVQATAALASVEQMMHIVRPPVAMAASVTVPSPSACARTLAQASANSGSVQNSPSAGNGRSLMMEPQAASAVVHSSVASFATPPGQVQDQVQRHIYAEIERLRTELQGLSELCRNFKFS